MNVGFNKPDPPSEKQMQENDDTGTVFVRGLASSVDDEKLLNRFSDVGPVRSAFVVRTGAGGASKGFGFVKFAIESDAQVAIETLNGAPMDGKILGVFPAQRRGDGKSSDDNDGKKKAYLTSDERQRRKLQEKEAKQGRLEERIGGFSTELLANTKRRLCVLLLWDIPTKASASKSGLKKWLSKRDIDNKRVKNIVLKIDKQDPMLAAVNISPATAIEFENDKIAKAAYHRLKLAKIIVRRHAAVTFKHALRQRCRLIIRNLAWSVRDNDLITIFSEFGPIQETNVPTVPGDAKRIRGFGFVQFIFYSDAMKALQNCNGRNIKGREVAVDWTISGEKADEINVSSSDDEDDDNSNDFGDEDNNVKKNSDYSSSSSSSSSDSSSEDDDNDSNDSSSDSSSSDDENDEEDLHQPAKMNDDNNESKNNHAKIQENEFSIFVQNLPFEVKQKDVFDVFKRYGPCKMVKLVRVKATGQHRGSAFVHYYTEQGVKNALAAGAGRIVNNDTDDNTKKKKKKSKRDREIQSALAEAALNSGILINERKLNVLPALKKDELKSIEESREGNNERGKVDRRHLYLAKEGFIPEGDGTLQIPRGDRTKRDNIQKEKKMKLKNPNFFVSPTRLSIRNINTKPCRIPRKFLPPKHSTQANKDKMEEDDSEEEEDGVYKVVDGKLLKTIAINAARDGMRLNVVRRDEGDQTLMSTKDAVWEGKRVMVTEAKVVCDPINTYADGTPVSRGYGFIEFTEHAHALAALRMLNNNPEYFMFTPGPSGPATPMKSRQRLIVEFSCEDARKLLKQKKNLEARKEKSLQRAAELGLNNNSKKSKKKRKQTQDDAAADDDNILSKKKKHKRRNRNNKSKHTSNDSSMIEDDNNNAKSSKGDESMMDVEHTLDTNNNSDNDNKKRRKDNRSKTLKAIDKRGGSLSSRRERKKSKRGKDNGKNAKGKPQGSGEVNFDDLVSKYKKRLEKSNILQQGASSSSSSSKKKSRWFDE